MKADNGLHTCVTITRVSWCQNTNSVSERRCPGLRFICCCYNRLPGTRYALSLLTINRHCIRLTCRHPAHAVSVLILDPYGDTGSSLTNYNTDVWHVNAVRTREQITQLIILRSYSSTFSTLSGRADSSTL